jgi:hypothetical protein
MDSLKVIKVWNARNLNCLQTLVDKLDIRAGLMTHALYDSINHQLVVASTKLDCIPVCLDFPVIR